mgnify:CR=1 FL=1
MARGCVLLCVLLLCTVVACVDDTEDNFDPYSFCPGFFRRLLLSPTSESSSGIWKGAKMMISLKPLQALTFWIDAVLWASLYPFLELLSITGMVPPPSCGFARLAPCPHYPCWIFFMPNSTTYDFIIDCFGILLAFGGAMGGIAQCILAPNAISKRNKERQNNKPTGCCEHC